MTPDESALVIPARGLPPYIDTFRERYVPDARAGVPAHITVVYPFLAPAALSEDVIADLVRLVGRQPAFQYSLVALREFAGGILYLAPSPAEPFVALTRVVSGRFGIQPYSGLYEEVVPHLTVAQTADEPERRRLSAVLEPALPLAAAAEEVWLMVGHTHGAWRTSRTMRLGSGEGQPL